MQEIRLNYATLSESLDELSTLKAAGWTMRFSSNGAEIIARKITSPLSN
ncbi:MAG: hypothetical protein RL571_3415 [Pseudomonadota bacterium]|jgi:hypothetical protein|nr:hypothetical protein [Janthinobacterium sp. B9-8]